MSFQLTRYSSALHSGCTLVGPRTNTLPEFVGALRQHTGEAWPKNEKIGECPLRSARKLTEIFNEELRSRHGISFTGRLWVKLEGKNCTGTHKDRPMWAHVAAAIEQGCKGITIATCGNAGEALALACAYFNLPCTIVIPANAEKEKSVARMKVCGAQVIIATEPDGSPSIRYKRAVEVSTEIALMRSLYDANSEGPNRHVEINAYRNIGREIGVALGERYHIDGYACAVGNGGLYVGIGEGLDQVLSYKVPGIGGTLFNPLSDAARHRQRVSKEIVVPQDIPYYLAPLATENPADKLDVLARARCGGDVVNLSVEHLERAVGWIQRASKQAGAAIRPIEASASAVGALFSAIAHGKLSRDGNYVIVLSGEID